MKYKHIYFIGIGGIGMSAIARFYNFKGYEVSGYDRTPSDLTEELEAEGIAIHYEDRPDLIPADVEGTLVIYTPAIPADLGELIYVNEHDYKVIKRSQMLGELTEGQHCLAVAGTHGKTTTSTLTAHILTESGVGCSAFLGGISANYGTNLLTSSVPNVVVEADEFDRSFLKLHPEIAVITAMDADHLDIYGDLEHVQAAFRQFASQVSGTVIAKYGLDITSRDTAAKILTYHFNDVRADFHATNLRVSPLGQYTYDLEYPGGMISGILVGTLGWVNVENSIAAAAIALTFGIEPEAIRKAIGTFRGAQRRIDVHVNTPGITYIDDYAHHPAELAAAISSIKGIFPERKLTAIFQPHLYSRTHDLADGFASALSCVDSLILLDIYPAREEPIPGVTSEIIFKGVTIDDKKMLHKEQLMDELRSRDLDVVVTFGAGDISKFIGPITELCRERI